MGINFNFGLGGKTGASDGNTGTGQAGASTVDPPGATTPVAGSATPPPTEPIMVEPIVPAAPAVEAAPPVAGDVNFGDDITINVTDAPDAGVINTPTVGEVQITEAPAEAEIVPEAVAATPVIAVEAPLNPFADTPPTVAAQVPAETINPLSTETAVAAPAVEASQATPLNPFAENTEPQAVTTPVSTNNPFATEAAVVAPATENTTNPFETEAPAQSAEAVNPFATETPAVVEALPEVPNNTVPAVDLTPAPVAENPFVSTQEAPKLEEAAISTESPTTELPAADATPVAVNPFADETSVPDSPAQTSAVDATLSQDTSEPLLVETITEEPSIPDVVVEPAPVAQNQNPFAQDTPPEMTQDNPFADEDEDTTAVVEKKATPPIAQASGNGSNPLSSLKNIKAEIEGFVALHNQNVADYKAQIKALEEKISDEKELLKKRKKEFKNMLGEIEALTEDFGGQQKKEAPKEKEHDSNQSHQNQDHQNKPKKKRNRKKKTNPEQNQEPGKQD